MRGIRLVRRGVGGRDFVEKREPRQKRIGPQVVGRAVGAVAAKHRVDRARLVFAREHEAGSGVELGAAGRGLGGQRERAGVAHGVLPRFAAVEMHAGKHAAVRRELDRRALGDVETLPLAHALAVVAVETGAQREPQRAEARVAVEHRAAALAVVARDLVARQRVGRHRRARERRRTGRHEGRPIGIGLEVFPHAILVVVVHRREQAAVGFGRKNRRGPRVGEAVADAGPAFERVKRELVPPLEIRRLQIGDAGRGDVDRAADRIRIDVGRERLGDFERLHHLGRNAVERVASPALPLAVHRHAHEPRVEPAHGEIRRAVGAARDGHARGVFQEIARALGVGILQCLAGDDLRERVGAGFVGKSFRGLRGLFGDDDFFEGDNVLFGPRGRGRNGSLGPRFERGQHQQKTKRT